MKTNNLFPIVEPNRKFREKLKLELLDIYNRQLQPRFSWRYLVTPSVALASLLLMIWVNNELFSPISSITLPNQPAITQSDIPDQQLSQEQQNGSSQPTVAEEPDNLDQYDQELTEILDTLLLDSDLEAAIDFRNL